MHLVFIPRMYRPHRRAVRARRAIGGPPVRLVPAVCVPTEALLYHGGILAIITASPANAYLRSRPLLACRHQVGRLPLPSCQARPPASILGQLTILTYSLGPLEACAVTHFLGIAPPRRSRSPPRPSPCAAVGCLSAQTPSTKEP
jgi:hypothetical protein